MEEAAFVAALRRGGARVFVVGGWVRDRLRGAAAADKDYVVSGIGEAAFCALFPDAQRVGRSFPVYLVTVDGKRVEVAFARREHKTGPGYRGFAVAFSPEVTIEEDLYRRDTTMNSIALELPEGRLIDLYGGREDIARGRVRAVSSHFVEDPVRALRAARQAALFGYEITEETLVYMRACRAELAREPGERIFAELRRALGAAQPSSFFRWLARAGVLDVTFPELAALIGKTQPQAFHPEGDAFEHTMLVLDRVAAETGDVRARFTALAHDIGKGRTPQAMLPHHYGHERRGVAPALALAERLRLPVLFRKAGALAAAEHMKAGMFPTLRPGTRRDLLWRVHQAGLSAPFWRLADADSNSRISIEARRQLAALLAVSLPPDWRNKGEQSARKLRELHCRALAELPADPASTH